MSWTDHTTPWMSVGPSSPPSWPPAHPVVAPSRAGLCRSLVIAGASLTFLGSLLPWATIDIFGATISKNGTDGDGVLTLIGALVIAGLAIPPLWGHARKGLFIGALVAAILVTVVAFVDIVDVASRVGDINNSGMASASVGYGLWITAVGGIVAVVSTATSLGSIVRR